MTDPLNNMRETSEIDFSLIPISAVRSETRNVLSALLDPPKIFLTDEGIPRDWRGLAHLTGISSAHVPSLILSDKPTATVLYRWSQKGVQVANIKKLQIFLQTIDRYDVVDDTYQLLETDAKVYHSSQLLSGPIIKSSTSWVTDNEIITRDDAELAHNGINKPQFYDAFVLYADEDIDFVKELVERMESFGFKLCLKDRDLLGGISSQHTATMKLIAERCHRLIIILSPAFVDSPLNNFIVEFALIGGIQNRTRKIIPCLYKSCEIQQSLQGYFLLFYRSDSLVNFWDKLKGSLLLSPNEMLALGDKISPYASTVGRNNNRLPTLTISNATENDCKVLPSISNKLEDISIAPYNIDKKTYSSMLDLNQGYSGSNSTLTEQGAKTNSNPSIDEIQNKNSKKKSWYHKILKFGQSSSHQMKLKKSKMSKKAVVAL